MSLGVYIHLPYCAGICPYCDFNAYVDPKPPWEELAQAIVRELRSRAPAFGEQRADTLYFGGGTPSLAPPEVIGTLVRTVRMEMGLREQAEVTLETNPGRLTAEKLAAFREQGINRLSLGWQSTHDPLLRTLGRGHSAADSHAAYLAGREGGFDNISIDLIFAVPGQSMADLQADLDQIERLAPEHVSLYALTYKANTPMTKRRDQGRLKPACEDLELEMMQRIEERLQAAGYEHYEVSNYARPNRRAVHNSLYWQGARYLGLGPGAHSFHHQDWQSGHRWESVRDPRSYLQTWSQTTPARIPMPGDPTTSWAETLTARQLFAERMLCATRQAAGLDVTETICAAHPGPLAAGIAQAQKKGWANLEGNHLRPTPQGLENADALAALFF